MLDVACKLAAPCYPGPYQDADIQPGGASYWGGSAAPIGGGFTWADVYLAAHDNGVVVVGGNCPTVGIIDGYLQRGGHGAAMHEYGLGSDQVLEFNVGWFKVIPREGTDDLDAFLDATTA
ncbi:isoamyl alcohol oxidase [Trichoderma arundinaceum]|uniref:Isoamyl alcohol oxidase n=1 Tax=Trichoderma arundinaceum TaxID=490622 RepID=A0A395NAJ4_TRIAR|nr:isoamyl alcohol oxidase [Trichoderma arundinaceum]